ASSSTSSLSCASAGRAIPASSNSTQQVLSSRTVIDMLLAISALSGASGTRVRRPSGERRTRVLWSGRRHRRTSAPAVLAGKPPGIWLLDGWIDVAHGEDPIGIGPDAHVRDVIGHLFPPVEHARGN